MPAPVYYVEVTVARATVALRLNGIGVETVGGPAGGFLAAPLNENLVEAAPDGSANRLVLSVAPAPDSAQADALDALAPEARAAFLSDLLDEADAYGLVKRYGPGDVAGAGSADGEVVARFSLEAALEAARAARAEAFGRLVEAAPAAARAALAADSAARLAVVPPVEVVVEFESPGAAGFRGRLVEAEPADREAVLDYAVRLRDMAAARDLDGLYRAFRPKEDDYNLAYPDDVEDPRASVEENFEAMFESGLLLDFDREDVEPVSYNGGRVWELTVPRASTDEDAFFLTEGKDGYIYDQRVDVGLVDGELRVVR